MQEEVTVEEFLIWKGYLEYEIKPSIIYLSKNIPSIPDVTILCLKYGDKYSSDYVNKLYNMVSRNTKINFEFVCITEDAKNLNTNIRVIHLDVNPNIKGWWYKPFVFSRDIDIKTNTVLFLDLDVIVFDSIDKFFEFKPKETFVSIKGFTSKNTKGINSSCFRFDRSKCFYLYDEYISQYKKIIEQYVGDQDWINDNIKSQYWPKEWVQSFKHDMMQWPENRVIKNSENIKKLFLKTEPIIRKGSSIAVFHGRPNPHELQNKWCLKHWK